MIRLSPNVRFELDVNVTVWMAGAYTNQSSGYTMVVGAVKP